MMHGFMETTGKWTSHYTRSFQCGLDTVETQATFYAHFSSRDIPVYLMSGLVLKGAVLREGFKVPPSCNWRW